MTTSTDSRLTSGQRLARGLAHTAAGPVDVTRGAVGLTAQSVAATVGAIRRRYRNSKLRAELAEAQELIGHELVEAQEAVARTIADVRSDKGTKRRRLLIFGAAGVATLAAGGVLFAVVRRSRKPEPSALPPSVEYQPKP
ncbi:MAG: cell wall synthesis protein CwsA [Mycobacterium sp.]|nr:cell wall synthesis protein CwsA [Mycobacterium sp.]